MQRGPFQNCCQCPGPRGEHLLMHASTGDPPGLAGRSGSASCGITAPFIWVLMHTGFCLCCPPRVESLFSPVLWKSCKHIPLTFKVRFPGDSLSFCQIPGLGSLTWGSEPWQQWESFLGIIVLQIVGCPPGVYGILFYHVGAPPTISL